MTYFTSSSERTPTTPAASSLKETITGTSIDLEPTLAIFPAPHIGLLLQAVFALPVAGTESQTATLGANTLTSPDADSRWRSIGAFVGVVVAL
jgi:hypothetical protein